MPLSKLVWWEDTAGRLDPLTLGLGGVPEPVPEALEDRIGARGGERVPIVAPLNIAHVQASPSALPPVHSPDKEAGPRLHIRPIQLAILGIQWDDVPAFHAQPPAANGRLQGRPRREQCCNPPTSSIFPHGPCWGTRASGCLGRLPGPRLRAAKLGRPLEREAGLAGVEEAGARAQVRLARQPLAPRHAQRLRAAKRACARETQAVREWAGESGG